MPVISVPESITSRTLPGLIMNSPLLFDTDTLTGTCQGLVFDHFSDGSQLINVDNATAMIRNLIAPNFRHARYSVYSINRGIVYLRLNLTFHDPDTNGFLTHSFYLKARDHTWLLAFLMGSHPRLGEGSEVLHLPGDSDVFPMISRHL